MFAPGRLAEIGEFIYNPNLADTFEAWPVMVRGGFMRVNPGNSWFGIVSSMAA